MYIVEEQKVPGIAQTLIIFPDQPAAGRFYGGGDGQLTSA